MAKCKTCNSELIFDPISQKLKCLACGNFYDISTFNENKEENVSNVKEHICKNCGASLLTYENTAVTFCSYCGSSNIIEENISNQDKSNFIIPFKLSKEECINIYKKQINKAFFAPDDMKKDEVINKIRGIYIPYYVYSFSKDGEQVDRGEKYSHSSGNYEYFDVYSLTTNLKAEYKGIAHDASVMFSDDLSEGIAPFDIKDKKEFDTLYTCGFYADKVDIDNDYKYMETYNKIAESYISKEMEKDSIYKKYGSKPEVDLDDCSKEKALYPVYFLSIRNKNNDRISYAVINGQTGKMAADIPIDYKKMILFSAILTIPVFVIINLMLTLNFKGLIFLSILFGIIDILIINKQNYDIKEKEKKSNESKKSSNRVKITFGEKVKNNFLNIIGILILIITIVLNPICDIYYYIAVLIDMLISVYSFGNILKNHNIFTTRKLPHLNSRGGDENA